jgi:hypothetical protein
VNTENTTETEVKSPLLSKLHSEFLARTKPVEKKDAELIVANWKKASLARERAEAAFVAAQKAESDAVAAIVRARGKGRVKIDGKDYVPMSRGNTAYLRREGSDEVPTFG